MAAGRSSTHVAVICFLAALVVATVTVTSTQSLFNIGPSVSAPEQHAIVTLLHSDEQSIVDYCFALKSLSKHSIVKPTSPILVFHERDFPTEAKEFLKTCTKNTVRFYREDFSFPPEFDADDKNDTLYRIATQGTRKEPTRKMWGYTHMIRFWTSKLWKHPAVRPYATVMRIDADSCFIDSGDTQDLDTQFLPGIRGRYVYRTDNHGTGVDTWIEELYGFAVEYMKREAIVPRNPELWELISKTWDEEKTLPIFYKNFEVVRVSFFLREDVMKWHEALTEEKPFGVYRYRWSDANTRVFTMAMFGKPEALLEKKHPGYRHSNDCLDYRKGQDDG